MSQKETHNLQNQPSATSKEGKASQQTAALSGRPAPSPPAKKKVSFQFVDGLLVVVILMLGSAILFLILMVLKSMVWNEVATFPELERDIAGVAQPLTEEEQEAQRRAEEGTIFLGDSNTVRLSAFGLVDSQKVFAQDSIGINAVTEVAFVRYKGEMLTMKDVVETLQPQRVVMTFGTNNIGGSLDMEGFIEAYSQVVGQLRAVSPGSEIMINSIPPVGRNSIYPKVTRQDVQEYNQALAELCAREGMTFLNSYSVLADEEGYLKREYSDGDGIHLTQAALESLLEFYALSVGQ